MNEPAPVPRGSHQSQITRLAYAVLTLRTADRQRTAQGFAATPGGEEARILSEALARVLPLHWTRAGDRRTRRATSAVSEYLEAVRGASDATLECAQSQHGARRCWFSVEGPADGVCTRVRTVASRLRDADLHVSGPLPVARR